MKIIAVDPGSVTGWALDGRSGATNIAALKAAPRKGRPEPEPEYVRCGNLWGLLDVLYEGVPVTVVCEGAAGFMKGKHAVRVSNELRGVVKAWCAIRGARYVEVQPQDLQRFAAGRCQVPKDEMVRLARERYGYQGSDDNTADALHLLAWAKANLAAAKETA